MNLLIVSTLLLAATAMAPEDKVDRLMKASLESLRIPGASVVVIENGKVVKSAAYGVANVEYDVPATPQTRYLLASITKSFTATAILMLVEEGKVRLNEPISTYLEDAPETWKPITVRMLLAHAAGLRDRWEEVDRSKWRLYYSTADMYSAAKATPLDFTPGTRWQYSDQGYFLLGRIIEKVSGVSYRQFLAARIFTPCGMDASTTTSQTEIVKNLAQGYTLAQGQWFKNDRRTDYGLVSHFGIVSSALDLAKFDQALMAGKLLKPESLALMWSAAHLPDGDVPHIGSATYGLGWFLEELNGHRVVQHGGSTGTGYLKLPDDNVTVIVLTNLEQLAGGDGIGLAKVIAQAYVKGLAYDAAKATADPDPKLGKAVCDEMANLASGKMTRELYTPPFAAALEPSLPRQKAGLAPLGPIKTCAYLSGSMSGQARSAVYRLQYEAVALDVSVTVDKEGKIMQMSAAAAAPQPQ